MSMSDTSSTISTISTSSKIENLFDRIEDAEKRLYNLELKNIRLNIALNDLVYKLQYKYALNIDNVIKKLLKNDKR